MFRREIAPPSQSFFLFGPRGTGKTTWIREHYPRAHRYDLLQRAESLRLNRDPRAFARECAALPSNEWVVVDEVQKAPSLLDEVQRLLQERKQRFVLSGSSARKLRRGGANLLAGRAEVRHLFPFVSAELGFERDLDDALRFGMLPLAVVGGRPRAFLKAYAETYLHEEIQAEAIVREIGSFSRFLEVAARVNGQVVNATGLARDSGVARQTAQAFFQILVDTLLGSWLEPWRAKRGVKQVAHPKFHFFDCGVVRQLAGVGHLEVHPAERGFLLETYLLHELRAFLHYRELDYPIFYWRTHDGTEVDFIVEAPKTLFAIEVKSAARWDSRFATGLLSFRARHPEQRVETLAVYAGARVQDAGGIRIYPWLRFLRAMWGGEIFR